MVARRCNVICGQPLTKIFIDGRIYVIVLISRGFAFEDETPVFWSGNFIIIIDKHPNFCWGLLICHIALTEIKSLNSSNCEAQGKGRAKG